MGDPQFLKEPEGIVGGKTRQGAAGKFRVGAVIIGTCPLAFNLDIGEVAPPVAGGQNFLAHPRVLLQDGDGGAQSPGNNSGYHSGGATPHYNYAFSHSLPPGIFLSLLTTLIPENSLPQ